MLRVLAAIQQLNADLPFVVVLPGWGGGINFGIGTKEQGERRQQLDEWRMFRIEPKVAGLPVTPAGRQVNGFIRRLTILPCTDTLHHERRADNGNGDDYSNRGLSMMLRWFRHDQRDWLHDRTWWWLVGVSAFINAGTWAVMLRVAHAEHTFAPLHYTIYFGTDLSSNPRGLMLMPALGTAIVLAHALTTMTNQHEVWRRSWAVMALTLNALLLASSAALYYVASVLS